VRALVRPVAIAAPRGRRRAGYQILNLPGRPKKPVSDQT
jgi:hypothetical protein